MKYLFKALLNDGTIIEQTIHDSSQTTPGKNAFYDVLQKIEQVRAFAFYNTETNDEYVVDLADGHFEVNGVPFQMHDEPVSDRRLVYFKRNIVNVLNGEPQPAVYTYHFGWQGNDPTGKNIQRVMVLS